jgi:hypothetical protein
MAGERETTLEELLSDPIIRQVMASYGVQIDEIRCLFRTVGVRNSKLEPAREAAGRSRLRPATGDRRAPTAGHGLCA